MKLEDINKENCFKVPDNYFDNFYNNLQNRLKEEKIEIVETKNKSKIYYLKPLFKIAAILILMLLLIKPETYNNIDNNITEYTEYEDYTYYLVSNISDYELYEQFYSEDNDEINNETYEELLRETSNMSEFELFQLLGEN